MSELPFLEQVKPILIRSQKPGYFFQSPKPAPTPRKTPVAPDTSEQVSVIKAAASKIQAQSQRTFRIKPATADSQRIPVSETTSLPHKVVVQKPQPKKVEAKNHTPAQASIFRAEPKVKPQPTPAPQISPETIAKARPVRLRQALKPPIKPAVSEPVKISKPKPVANKLTRPVVTTPAPVKKSPPKPVVTPPTKTVVSKPKAKPSPPSSNSFLSRDDILKALAEIEEPKPKKR